MNPPMSSGEPLDIARLTSGIPPMTRVRVPEDFQPVLAELPSALPATALFPPDAHLEQYAGPWAIDEIQAGQLLSRIRQTDWSAHVAAAAARPRSEVGLPALSILEDGVALIELRGFMTKYGSSFSSAGGTIELRRTFREARRSSEVRGVLFVIDSPGGSATGVDDLALEVAATAAEKPVYAVVEDLAASGGYYAAAMATRISANPSALVGSIGVYTIIDDVEQMFRQRGITTYVVRSGRFKGLGIEGEKISELALADRQRVIDGLHAQFAGRVAAGRKMKPEQVAGFADGRIFPAAEAQRLGLIDAVETFDQTLAALRATASPKRESRRMDTNKPDGPKAATLVELKRAFPNAAAEFHLQMLEREATMEQAHAAYSAELETKAAAMDKQLAELKVANEKLQAAAATPARKPGVRATSSVQTAEDGGQTADPIQAFEDAVSQKMKAGMSRDKAVRAVAVKDPELHAAYLQAYNEQRGRGHVRIAS